MKNFQIYLKILQKNWWLIAITTLVALTVSLASSYFATPMYRTTALFIVSPSELFIANEDNLDVVKSIEALDKRSIIATYVEIMNSNHVYNDTVTELAIDGLSEYTVNAVVLPDSSAIELTVEGSDPFTTVQLANTLGNNAINYIQALYQVYDIILLDEAATPRRPFSPVPARDAGVAAVLGLIIGTTLAFANGILTPLAQTWLQAAAQQNRENRLEERLAQIQTDRLILGVVKLRNINRLNKRVSEIERENILQQAEKVIHQNLPEHTLIEQWNNASFAILLPDTTISEAQIICQRLQESLSETQISYQENQKQFPLNVTVGLVDYQDGDHLSQLIDQAEKAARTNHFSKASSAIVHTSPSNA